MRTRLRLLGFVVGLLGGLAVARLEPTEAEASRNSGGTYTLPSGNPVVSGTTITSTWANNTLNDIGTELTNSLDRTGRGGMTGQLKLSNGSSSAPAATFSSELTSGLYRAGTNDVRMQVASTTRENWTATGVEFPLEAVTFTGPPDAGAAIIVTGGTNGSTGNQGAAIVATGGGSYGQALIATGVGSASAIVANGGTGKAMLAVATSSDAISAVTTAGTSAAAVRAEHTTAGTGYGVVAQLSAASGSAVYAIASSGGASSYGVTGGNTGSGFGGYFTGTSSGYGLGAGLQSSSTSGTRYATVRVDNGDVLFYNPVAPASTTSITNSLTAANIVKAYGAIQLTSSPTLLSGFNIASISCSSNVITVNVAGDFADGLYVVVPSISADEVSVAYQDNSTTPTGGVFKLAAKKADGGVVDLCTTVLGPGGFVDGKLQFIAIGAQ